MRLMSLMLGAAALALTAPVAAQPGQGNGKGQDKAEKGNGKGKGNGKPARVERRQDMREQAREARQDNRERIRDRRDDARDRARDRAEERRDRIEDRNEDRRDRYDDRRDRNIVDRTIDRDRVVYRYGDRSNANYQNDCPPGLAKKNNGCLPPGQARKLYGQRFEPRYAERELFGAYRDWYGRDDDYRYRIGEDFLYRIGAGDIIDGLIPLYDRRGYYYPVGSRYPSAYDSYNLPYQYRDYYDDPSYRYGDGAIYRVDPETQLIQAVAALLTGDVAVGQRLPTAYSVYNVPQPYRARYSDGPESYYRYSDGYIYRVDPTTMLVAEIIEAIV